MTVSLKVTKIWNVLNWNMQISSLADKMELCEKLTSGKSQEWPDSCGGAHWVYHGTWQSKSRWEMCDLKFPPKLTSGRLEATEVTSPGKKREEGSTPVWWVLPPVIWPKCQHGSWPRMIHLLGKTRDIPFFGFLSTNAGSEWILSIAAGPTSWCSWHFFLDLAAAEQVKEKMLPTVLVYFLLTSITSPLDCICCFF